MREYAAETAARVAWIREVLRDAGATGVVFGNSGGKDSALVGILCKLACDDTLGLILPCGSRRNFESDRVDGEALAGQFSIATRMLDLTPVREELVRVLGGADALGETALKNLAPRLRMTALYGVAAAESRLVAGTGNRSERHMGYFTKWGDGACDFNPISDLTVTETYEFLRHLGAPLSILEKAPSAGLFEGQTDEAEMGITYRSIDEYLQTGRTTAADRAVIDRFHRTSAHKRRMPLTFAEQP